ncbi:MAG TPA: hypothetical protein VNO21_04355 [Polyangiaceae bacterium]|nr:hypothetical protein [Polyangiaceae bacterium]
MTTLATTAREEVRNWVLLHAKDLSEASLTDTTPLLEARHITSLLVPDLLLLLESLRQEPIDLANLKAGDLRDLRTIYARFLPE